MVEEARIPHPDFKAYTGHNCDVTVRGRTFQNRVVTFAGINMLGQDVIVFDRTPFRVDDWRNVSVRLVGS